MMRAFRRAATLPVLALSATAAFPTPALAEADPQKAIGQKVSSSATSGFASPDEFSTVKRGSEKVLPPGDLEDSLTSNAARKVKAGAPSELCGTSKIQKTSGQGKTTLVLSVEESVETELSTEVKVEIKVVSAAVGFSVTKKRTITDQTRFEVPKGKMGYVEAYPLYDAYPLHIYEGKKKVGSGSVMRPVGVCFNEWAK